MQAQQALPIQVDLDQASFAYDASQSLVEIYLSFEAITLPFVADPDYGYRATVPVNLSILRGGTASLPGTSDGALWADSLALSFVVADTSAFVTGQHYLHQVRALVEPGEYRLQLVIPADEALARTELMLRKDIVVGDFSDPALVGLSDLTLASQISPSELRDDPFYKNGLLIRPNANQLFGNGLNRVFYYAESYHADQIAAGADQYTVLAYISAANQSQPMADLQRRMERAVRSPDVLAGSFNVTTLPSGSYFLRIVLLNDASEAFAEQSRKFFVYNPGVQVEAPVAMEANFETSSYASMPVEEVEQQFDQIELIAAEPEIRRMGRLVDLDEKRRFLMEFWQARDPNPGTPENEYQQEFFSLVQYANDRYSTTFDEGWKTDRGRTIIKYGRPTSIEPNLYSRELVPHELWNYNNIPGEGQAQFVFADRSGFGEFDMIHSTVAGERKMANWQTELRR